jgi:DNA-binding MarR family transcriptional regulator
MNEKQQVFLHPKRAAIAHTIYILCNSRFEECYASRIHRELAASDTAYETIHKAIHVFEDYGWIERAASRGRAKPITLTDRGDDVFAAVTTLMTELDDETDG